MAVNDPIYLVVIAMLLVAVTFLGFLFALRRFRHRRATLAKELSDAPDLLPDRAYNAIVMGRTEANLLARDGFDVRRQLERLDEAQGLSDRRDFVGAAALARSVHDTMVQIRRTGQVPGGGGGVSGSTRGSALRAGGLPRGNPPTGGDFRPELLPTEEAPEPADDATEAAVPPALRLPKNRVESQFELELLTEELGRAAPTDANLGEAAALRAQASTAFSEGEYTEALRLALRGRRRLGSKVESLAAHPAASARTPVASGNVGQAGATCASCGRDLRPDDVFCRSCGQPRPAGTCPRCGAAIEGADQFCGRCGAPRAAA